MVVEVYHLALGISCNLLSVVKELPILCSTALKLNQNPQSQFCSYENETQSKLFDGEFFREGPTFVLEW